MCGIAGVVSRGSLTGAQDAALARMLSQLQHRGPDGTGRYRDPGVDLGITRLAVIDLAGGMQPLFSEDASVVLIVNGEIYNYVELRRTLMRRGHRFATATDSEVIVHLYEDHELDFVQELRGMFALALWDRRRRRLVLARDRMGEKPLYLHEEDDVLYFSSEMKSLLACGAIAFDLDPDAVHTYFHLGYIPEPQTALRRVRKLPAASMLVIDVDSWSRSERKYWSMEDVPPMDGDPGSLIREQLGRVSELVVRSDVPVGIALSGGMDSSAIAVLAARAYPGTLQAFSVGYPGAHSFDERREARELCTMLDIPFHSVEIDVAEMTDFFPTLVFLRDDPIADHAGQGYYAVMRAAHDAGIRVMLQGQGGDELFWGYEWLRQASHLSRDIEANEPAATRMAFYDRLVEFQLARARMPVHYTRAFLARVTPQRLYAGFTFPRPWPSIPSTLTRLMCETYLMENGVAQGDRLSMASSVELRLPFLDHRLVETVIGLRKGRPDDQLTPKAWLREAVRDVLPPEILSRPKRGFGAPVGEWERALFARYGDSLRGGFLVSTGALDPSTIEMLARGDPAKGAVSPIFFRALVLETWCQAMRPQIELGFQ